MFLLESSKIYKNFFLGQINEKSKRNRKKSIEVGGLGLPFFNK